MATNYEEFNMVLAKILQGLRVEAGLSQEALASQLRWDQSTVSRIEARRRKVEVAEMMAWIEETNGDLNTVFGSIRDAWRRRWGDH